MRLLQDSVSAADAEGHYSGGGGCSVCFADFPEGVLLRGLSFHLDKRRGANPGSVLAPFLSRTRAGRPHRAVWRRTGKDQLSWRCFGFGPKKRAARDTLLAGGPGKSSFS